MDQLIIALQVTEGEGGGQDLSIYPCLNNIKEQKKMPVFFQLQVILKAIILIINED